MSTLTVARVLERDEPVAGYRLVRLHTPQIAAAARPGQFVHVRCSEDWDPLLRRPLSIHGVDRDAGEIHLLYRVAGRGTAKLDRFNRLDLLGPLGRGFDLPGRDSRVVVVAGGIGIAPLFFLLQEMSRAGCTARVLLGARTAGQLLAASEIEALGHQLEIATDDGTAGYRGRVTELAVAAVSWADAVFACGPRLMLQELAGLLAQYQVPGQFSLEEKMGCGVGACLACACKTTSGYKRVCVDGPVFPAGEVIWE